MSLKEYKVWDASTRIFHWVNVICVLSLIAIGTAILNASALGASNNGKILLKTIHVYVGYVFAINLAWRLVWAFVGGPYARWSALLPFRKGYATQLGHELSAVRQGKPVSYLGHTPLGRMAVTVLLLILTVQAVTGIVLAGTDVYMPPFGRMIAEWVAADGLDPALVRPYAHETVNKEAYDAMRAMRSPVVQTHEQMYFVLLGLIVLHIAAVVLTELRHGGGIISAMFTGRKTLSVDPQDRAP
ncbi:MAG: cytochrome b/b6 domain-containing protein [Rhodospirillaceae bacterium]|nr:cytochrome b/b6 domain-containing protein [Rhodospirillaceae bacterium]